MASAVAAVTIPGGVAHAEAPVSGTVVGQLVQAWPESHEADHEADHEAEAPISWLQTAEGDAVRIPTEDVEGIPTGTTLQVTVAPDAEDDTEDPLHDVESAQIVARAPVPPVLRNPAGLTNQVTVVRVNPDGVGRDSVSAQQLVDAVDGPVADFWYEQSNGAIQVGVTTAVPDWVTPVAGCADPTALWTEVAGTVGFVPGPGRHLMLYVSSAATACNYALAEVGSSPTSGGRLYVRDTVTSVIVHELGHNFGLGHSSGRQCDAAVESASCRTAAYRDLYDVMGVSWSQLGSLNAPQASRLGVLPGSEQQTLTTAGNATRVTLAPFSTRAAVRALRLTDAEGVDYWLEYRTATGRDAWLGTAANRYRLETGVLLRRAEGFPDTSVLLDGTPVAAAAWDGDFASALPVGASLPVSGGDFTVVVESLSAAGAVLTVTPTPPNGPSVAARPAGTATGTVMPAAGPAAAPQAADAAGLVGAPQEGAPLLRAASALESAATSSGHGNGLLAAGAATVLAATTLLLVQRLRGRTLRAR
ncbi:hypothetical protein E4P40_05935 [Blastococcus sp. CT_GayMR20]|uniref:hypothetical protein n=1 Tax=Blastococcus sp. CT_GayMR20 TaxID=2559609 RepID=UPI001072FD6F|nr:hypothetical protein [Blastococcus sp. CT_GayMR20]TFV91566.1 hypothetical protein E4P40_05935 [Blastococcus sp. CT_GayMR20]